MPIIYLRHPVHGDKVAIAEQEAEFDEQNGWERYNPAVKVDELEADNTNFLIPEPRKRARRNNTVN